LLTVVIGWTNSHPNTAAVVANFIASLEWKSVKMPEKYQLQLQEMIIFYHSTALQPSSVNVPSPKAIGGLIDLA